MSDVVRLLCDPSPQGGFPSAIKYRVHEPSDACNTASFSNLFDHLLPLTEKLVSFPPGSGALCALKVLVETLEFRLQSSTCNEGGSDGGEMERVSSLIHETCPCWPLCRSIFLLKEIDKEIDPEHFFKHVCLHLLKGLTNPLPTCVRHDNIDLRTPPEKPSGSLFVFSQRQILNIVHVMVDRIREEYGRVSDFDPIEHSWGWGATQGLYSFLGDLYGSLDLWGWENVVGEILTILPKLKHAGHGLRFVEEWCQFLATLDKKKGPFSPQVVRIIPKKMSEALTEGNEWGYDDDGRFSILLILYIGLYQRCTLSFHDYKELWLSPPLNCQLSEKWQNFVRNNMSLEQARCLTKTKEDALVKELFEEALKECPFSSSLPGGKDCFQGEGSWIQEIQWSCSSRDNIETIFTPFEQHVGKKRVFPFLVRVFNKMVPSSITRGKVCSIATFLYLFVKKEIRMLRKNLKNFSLSSEEEKEDSATECFSLFWQVAERLSAARSLTREYIEWEPLFILMSQISCKINRKAKVHCSACEKKEVFSLLMPYVVGVVYLLESSVAFGKPQEYCKMKEEICLGFPLLWGEIWRRLSPPCQNMCLHDPLQGLFRARKYVNPLDSFSNSFGLIEEEEEIE